MSKSDDGDQEEIQISIPKPGETNLSDPTDLKVEKRSGTCAICLSDYVKGQHVVWSSNEECAHAFHHDCFVQWIEKQASVACVCCRRDFIHREVYGGVKERTKKE